MSMRRKLVVSRGALRDGEHQSFAEFRAEIQAELRQLAGNVGVQFFQGDAFEDLQVSIAGTSAHRQSWYYVFAQVVERRIIPALLQTRAASMASFSVSPATKRCDIRRVVPLVVTQCANP